MIKIMVSVVNWNNSRETNACLASIGRLPSAEQPDVVVVDNDSRREPLRIDKSIKLRSLKVTKNSSNVGFAAGHNPNIRTAKRQGYEYLVLLNNDTEIADTQVFGKLAQALADDPETLAANPTILSRTSPDIIWYGGGRLSFVTGRTGHLKVGKTLEPSARLSHTDLLTGGCLMMALKRANLDQLLLREDYFLYWEDTDWCARARRGGYKLLYVPNARLLHKVSSSLGMRSPFYIYYNLRNQLLFIRCNIRPWFWPIAWLAASVILLKYALIIILRYKEERGKALLVAMKGWSDGLRGKTGQTRQIV